MDNTVLASLLKVQQELKAPKDKRNDFGRYNYRSAESILEAAKPLCHANGLILTCSDEMVILGARFYVKAVAKVTDVVTGSGYESTAYAREDENKKGMDGAQLTGACSSYARKYALCGLLAIDDNKDADTNEYHNQTNQPTAQPTTQPQKNLSDAIKAKAEELNLTTKDLDLISVAVYKRQDFNSLSAKQLAHFNGNFNKVLDSYAMSQAMA